MVFEYMDHDLAGLINAGYEFSIQQIRCLLHQLLGVSTTCTMTKDHAPRHQVQQSARGRQHAAQAGRLRARLATREDGQYTNQSSPSGTGLPSCSWERPSTRTRLTSGLWAVLALSFCWGMAFQAEKRWTSWRRYGKSQHADRENWPGHSRCRSGSTRTGPRLVSRQESHEEQVVAQGEARLDYLTKCGPGRRRRPYQKRSVDQRQHCDGIALKDSFTKPQPAL